LEKYGCLSNQDRSFTALFPASYCPSQGTITNNHQLSHQHYTMPTPPTLPVELWYQILSYVVTPTRPVQVESWKDSKPILQFAHEDAEVQRSFTLFTGPQATEFPFPICQMDLWRQLVSQSCWLLQRTADDIEKLVWKHWPCARHDNVPYAHDLSQLQTVFTTAQVKHVDVVIDTVDYFEDGHFIERMS